MSASLTLTFALITWLVIQNRSERARALVAVIAFLMGSHPASEGSRYGMFLMAITLGASMSLAWDILLGLLDRPSHRSRSS